MIARFNAARDEEYLEVGEAERYRQEIARDRRKGKFTLAELEDDGFWTLTVPDIPVFESGQSRGTVSGCRTGRGSAGDGRRRSSRRTSVRSASKLE